MTPTLPEALELQPVAWLRDAHKGEGEPCYVPAAKGDPGAFPVFTSAVLAEVMEALGPFAAVARVDIGDDETDKDRFRPMSAKSAYAPLLVVGDLRRARAIHGKIEAALNGRGR